MRDQVDKRLETINQAHEGLEQFLSEADDLESWSHDAVADLRKAKSDVAEIDDVEQITANFEVRLACNYHLIMLLEVGCVAEL